MLTMRFGLILLTIALALSAMAQKPNAELVQVGPRGVFVFTGPLLAREGGPVTSILIERKTGEQGEFKRVVELKPVTAAKDVQKGIDKAGDVLPYPIELGGLRADSIWARIQRYGTREQLGAASNNVAVLLAVNAVWHDADVKPGTLYQYRVTTQGNGNQFLSTFVNPASKRAVDRLMAFNSSYYEHQRELNTWWSVVGDHRPAVVQLHRSVDEEPFAVVKPKVRIERRGQDTVLYQFADTTAPRHRVYRYVAKGWDLFGNAMPVSDTLYAASLDVTQMPMPYDLHAVGDSSGRKINVRWKLNNAPVVKQISLQRSTNSETDFVTVAELSGDRTSYVDEDVRPATSYFYRFVLEYKATHVPMRGVSFAAAAYDPLPPSAPEELTADATKEGVTLTWMHPSRELLGFHVYRADGEGAFMLASARLPAAQGPVFAYTDTAGTLQAGKVYRYVVKAISTSHVEGCASDTVAVMPMTNAAMPMPPRDLTARVDGEALLLSWEDQSHDPLWMGYVVLRTRPGNRVDTLLRATNFLNDSLDASGKPSTYRVLSSNALGMRSAPSPAVSAKAHVRAPACPSAVAANPLNGKVVLTWQPPVSEPVQRFDVYRYTRGSEPVKVGSVSANKPARFEDVSPARGALNFYFVRSVAASGAESGASREVGVQL
jgi:fibronectin type 3 domain-containing protein